MDYPRNKSMQFGEIIVAHNFNRDINLMRFLRAGCRLFTSWPMGPTDKRGFVLSSIAYYAYIAFQVYGLLAVINGIRCCFKTLDDRVKSFVDASFLVETLFNLIYYRSKAAVFQRFIVEMENFFGVTNPRFMNPLRPMYYALMTLFIVGSMLFVTAPLIMEHQITPMNTAYPMIPREKYWGQSVTYLLNIFQISIFVNVLFMDFLIISIMWHTACKFYLLGKKLNNLNERKMRLWIMEHQEMISYARDINRVMGPILNKSTMAVAFYMIISGLILINVIGFLLSEEPVIDISKFAVVTVLSVIRFVACSWAADMMTQQAQGIAWDIYASPWIEASPRIRRFAVIIMQRCQKPIAVRTAICRAAWSLKFCAQVFYTVVNFFSTLKAALRV